MFFKDCNVYTVCSKLHKVLFLLLWLLCFFCLWIKYLGNHWTTCAKFTGKTCLVPHSDKFECQGQRSRSPGTKNCTPITPQQRRSGPHSLQARSCSSRWDHDVAARGYGSAASCVWFMFGKTSLASVDSAISDISWIIVSFLPPLFSDKWH